MASNDRIQGIPTRGASRGDGGGAMAATLDTVFRLISMAKPVTGVAAMQPVDLRNRMAGIHAGQTYPFETSVSDPSATPSQPAARPPATTRGSWGW